MADVKDQHMLKYKPITMGEAVEKGIPGKAIINGKEYTGYIYQGYFFHHVSNIGNCKILVKWCDECTEQI